MKMIVRQVRKNGYMLELIPAVTKQERRQTWLERVKKIMRRLSE